MAENGAIDPIAAANRNAERDLPFGDTADREDAERGLIAGPENPTITTDSGRVVWDFASYGFLADEQAPPTVHPSLWRQSRLVARAGLYRVTDGIHQVRGFDLSNMTLVEGDRGVIVIDPLISAETAAAALALYRRHVADRPVTAVIHTHSHVDHFGGVRGVVDAADVAAGRIPVIAPAGFLEHAVAENVYAGPAMARRSAYMYGAALPKGPTRQVGTGLGMTASTGSIGLLPPTLDITATGQEETVDGVRIAFQLTPGTEAPAEMNFFFPDQAALCVAENASHTLHNILTLRGALVRDPRIWARYLTEALRLFGDRADVSFGSHHWPTWGRDNVHAFLTGQRDVYAYLHDQTLRLINKGHTGNEIAEMLELPSTLDKQWHTRGYYGSVSHNVKAIYQRYMGWFDGNPAHLWELPPAESAARYVEFMGGADAVVEKARASFRDGELRWAAQVLNHVIFAEPDHRAARELQADVLEQLAYGAENGPWRNFYVTGAVELRQGVLGTPSPDLSPDMLAALTVDQLLDSLAIRLDGPRAAGARLLLTLTFTDLNEAYTLRLANGVLTPIAGEPPAGEQPDAGLSLDRPALDALLTGAATLQTLVSDGRVTITGDPRAFGTLMSYLDSPDPDFAIVTP